MRKFLVAAGVVLVAVVFIESYNKNPTYVIDAQGRVQSYLAYSYGPTSCTPENSADGDWMLKCQSANASSTFEYSVRSSAETTENDGRGFYLIAQNKSALDSAKVDLMNYLTIAAPHKK
jgi:hypothetical protein